MGKNIWIQEISKNDLKSTVFDITAKGRMFDRNNSPVTGLG